MIVKTTDEIRQHIAVIGNNDYSILRPHLKRAKTYLIDIIGKETYATALEHYHSEDYRNPNDEPYESDNEVLDGLVDAIQDALIYYAHYLYAPEANVIMTDNGFRVPWSDTVRPALEWQVKEAVSSMHDTAHGFIDSLIEYLDLNVEVIDAWNESSKIETAHSRIINTAKDFSYYFDIKNSRRVFLLLRTFQDEMERKHIAPALGSAMYAEIKDQIKDGDITPENQLILDYTKPALAMLTMYTAAKRLPKNELILVTNSKVEELQATAFAELKALEFEVAKIINPTLPVDDQKPTQYTPLLNYSDVELTSIKSISL